MYRQFFCFWGFLRGGAPHDVQRQLYQKPADNNAQLRADPSRALRFPPEPGPAT